MSRWTIAFKNHPIHETLDRLIKWTEIPNYEMNRSQLKELIWLKKILNTFKETVAKLDPEITPLDKLTNLYDDLTGKGSFYSQMGSLGEYKDAAELKDINEELSNHIHHLTWLVPFTKEYTSHELVNSLEDTIVSSLERLNTAKTHLDQHYKETNNKVEAIAIKSKEVDAQIDVNKRDVSQQLELLKQRESQTQQQIAQWQQQFSDAQEKRSNSYNEWREKIETETNKDLVALTNNAREKVNTLTSSTKDKLRDTLEDAREKRQEITNLFQLASGDSISGGYSQFANKENRQSQLWRMLALMFICITAIWIYSAYSGLDAISTLQTEQRTTEGDFAGSNKSNAIRNFDWHKFLLSFSLTGVLLFGAGYAGQQSNRHRDNERKMRWFALQIKALDPYINSLEASDQKELKKALTEKFFSGTHENEQTQGMIDENAINVVAKAMTDAIKAAKS